MTAPPAGPIEKKAKADLRKLGIDERNSAVAAAYILLARTLDEGVPNRELAAMSREMRLTYAQLREMGGTQKPDSFVDRARKASEERAAKYAGLHAVPSA